MRGQFDFFGEGEDEQLLEVEDEEPMYGYEEEEEEYDQNLRAEHILQWLESLEDVSPEEEMMTSMDADMFGANSWMVGDEEEFTRHALVPFEEACFPLSRNNSLLLRRTG